LGANGLLLLLLLLLLLVAATGLPQGRMLLSLLLLGLRR
jgi:hypothetical protein